MTQLASNGAELLHNLAQVYADWFNDKERRADGAMTANLYPYTAMFSPIQVNSVTLKNRLVMGPMGNICMADETGRPSAKMIQYFAARARGGVGLITSGLIPVSFDVDPSVGEVAGLSYFPRIDRSRTVYSGWRLLAETVHAYGARFFIQLTPGLGRVGSPECLLKKHALPVSASWNPNFYMPAVPCRPLTDGECWRIIKNAGQAAADAKSLLIDGVYLHGHEGYLLEQMTNPAFNRRKIGRFRDWQAFGIELVKHIRGRVGPRFPIMYRIDLSLALNETYGERMHKVGSLKRFANERTPEMTLAYMHELVAAGVDMFDVDLGSYDNWWLPHPPTSMPPGCFLPVAKYVRDDFQERQIRANTGLPVPIVAVGKLGYPDLAERALRQGMCDLIMLSRPLLADPEWPNKAYAGRVADIRPCIGDQEGCLNEFLEGGYPQCAVNPCSAHEDEPGIEPVPVSRPRKIAVVGAGPAGITCACTAAQRGHDVTLFERRDRPGGELIPGSLPGIKLDVANYLGYLERQLAAHEQQHKLRTYYGKEITAEYLKEQGFDAVIVASGAKPLGLPVPGADLAHVVQAIDLLLQPSLADAASQVVVVGAGAVGCEVAYYLAYERGKKVTVIEMLPQIMRGVCTANRGHLIHYLEWAGVVLMNSTRLIRIEEKQVIAMQNRHSSVPDPYNTWVPLLPANIKNPLEKPIRVQEQEVRVGADLVVLAVGLKPDDGLYHECVAKRVAPEVRYIGDAFASGRVFEAVKAGYAIGRAL